MELSGRLFTYNIAKRLTAFESGVLNSNKTIIFVGGLGDGYSAVPYLPLLNEKIEKLGYSLIQIQMTSSYVGYGNVTLSEDASELDDLISYLKQVKRKQVIFIIGHSTGCQDCYWHNKYGKNKKDVNGYILQAPVSDREYGMAMDPNFADQVNYAKKMIDEGNGSEWMPKSMSENPITANRFYSLGAYRGQDDVFSTDLSDEDLKELYKDLNQPMMLLHGEDDECYGSAVPKIDILKRIQAFCPSILKIGIISKADHSISLPPSQTIFIDMIVDFITLLTK
ncbi:hypothetical protein BJ944DRAFT_196870 [Cunninghamella echinulata]|nr:hypothetical protein BJ944DRAFT_196870 [Cunninghamella echinulata]